MLNALTVADALAIADAAARRSRDEKAMVDYLEIGRRRPARAQDREPIRLVTAVDPSAFDSPERRRLEGMIAELSPEARQELIALAWVGRSVGLAFDKALRRARGIPPHAQVGYIAAKPLERHIPAGLHKLNLTSR